MVGKIFSLNHPLAICFASLSLIYGSAILGKEIYDVDKLEGFEREIQGREEDGFNYYLITQFVKKRKEDSEFTEVPVLVMNGSPRYEGIHIGDRNGIRVTYSLDALKSKGKLPESIRPESSGPWSQESIQIKVDRPTIQSFLGSLGRDEKIFDIAAGEMTHDKAKLFYSLLFEDTLRLSTEALEAEKKLLHPEAESLPTLEGLGLSPTNADPDDTRVRISVPTAWDSVYEILLDITIASLDIHFTKKEFEFDPATESIRIKLNAASANITGASHNLGRFRNISRYFPFKPFILYDTVTPVKSATIGPFSVEFGFRLTKGATGYWKIQPVNEKRPLQLSMKLEDRIVHLDAPGLPVNSAKLSDEVVGRIESVLSETLIKSLSSSFAADDFGFRVPISLPYFERVRAADMQRPEAPNSEFEVQMEKFSIVPDGFLLSFNSRINRFKKPICAEGIQEGSERADLRAISRSSTAGASWKMQSSFTEKPGDRESAQWRVEGTELTDSRVKFAFTKKALVQLTQAAAIGGLYCPSSRALWPRAGFIPLLEFKPLSLPELSMTENEMAATVKGELLSYSRQEKKGRDQFELSSRKEVNVSLAISFDPSNQQLHWSPSQVNFSQLPAENDFMHEASKVLFSSFAKIDASGRVSLDTEFFLSKLSGGRFHFENFRIRPDRITGELPTKGFKFFDATPAKNGKPADEVLIAPKTERVDGIPTEIHFPNIDIRWKPNPELFFSTRKKKIDDKKWGEWSPFKSGDHESIHFDSSGRYYVQVKAMNRAFQIEETPVQYEFYYQEPVDQANLIAPAAKGPLQDRSETEKNAETPTQPAAPTEPSPPQTLSSKGLFGCSLRADTDVSFFQVLLLVFSLSAAIFLRRRSGSV